MSASSIGNPPCDKHPAFEICANEAFNVALPCPEGHFAFEIAVQFEVDSGNEIFGEGDVLFDRPDGFTWAGHG